MRARNVIFVGNCQALALCKLYREFAGPALEQRVDYLDDLGMKPDQVRAGVAAAELVVIQDRDFNHGLTDGLAPGVGLVNFPMALAGFIWPFANEPHVQNVALPPFTGGPYPPQLGDSFLNRLIRRGVPPEEALEQYLALDVARVAHLDRLFELYTEKQRERDGRTGFVISPVVEAEFRNQALFRTPHHPNAMLFGVIAQQLFERLEVPAPVIDAAIASLSRSPFPSDELPIHPAVIRHFGLRFADDATRYAYFDEGRFTFSEYVLRYMRYENNHALRVVIDLAAGGDPAEHHDALEAAVAQSPRSVRGWRLLGVARDRLGRAEAAHDAYARAVALEPNEADHRVVFGYSLLHFGRTEAALEQAEAAVALAPDYLPALQLLGEAQLSAGRAGEAADAFRALLRLQPDRSPVLQQLGIALMRTGDRAGAEQAVARAMAVAPERVDHRNLMAEVYEEQGRRDEAIALLESGPRDAQSYSLLGNFRLRNHQYEQAIPAFEAGVALEPGREDLVSCLADARALAGRQAA